MGEKELEIKLDITKKSRKINRPVQFHDQTGQHIILREKLSELREKHLKTIFVTTQVRA